MANSNNIIDILFNFKNCNVIIKLFVYITSNNNGSKLIVSTILTKYLRTAKKSRKWTYYLSFQNPSTLTYNMLLYIYRNNRV